MLWEKRKGCGPYEMPGGFGIVAFKEVLPRKVFYILLDLSFWDILLNIRHSYSLNFLSLCEQASGRIVILYLCFLLESPGPLSTPPTPPYPYTQFWWFNGPCEPRSWWHLQAPQVILTCSRVGLQRQPETVSSLPSSLPGRKKETQEADLAPCDALWAHPPQEWWVPASLPCDRRLLPADDRLLT